ncbi:MDR family MFS transporter [Nocardia albiluteola]|uniref:MDR family MFS transporter n=1 Tax=Nocardia albiluteola TaxID=2842303 RepID=UPI0027DEEA79|nr:MDR family MFS transporter [Nocardia albiluteola]
MDGAVGGTVAGYVIEGVLGRGGMGTVYLARHPRLPRLMALKVLNRDVAADPELRARFDREASVVAHLDHPGIVAVQDRGIEDGQLWLAMQYVQGVDASRLDPRTVTVERAVRIVSEVAHALDYAHARGVLHRDVKPANILLAAAEAGRAERAVLTDFGIARLLASNTQLTSSGTFVATLAFASPEQLSGDPVDARSDQYSLACSLYALLVGQSPFAAAEPGQVVAGHLAKSVPPIVRPDVPPQLNAVIARGMAKNPGERFSSAGEFAAAAMSALRAAVPAAAPTVQYAGAVRAPGFAPPPMPGPQPFGVYPAPAPRNPWIALCALLVGAFFLGLTSNGLGPAYTEIMHSMAATNGMLTWMTTGYALAALVLLPAAARLGDRFGPKNIYIAGLALLMLGAAGCFLAANMAMLTVFFAIQGLGMGLMLPQPLAVIIRTFPPERRGAALGVWAGIGALTVLLGPAADAALVELVSWRMIFVLDIPFGVLALILAAVLVPSLPAQRRPADPVGLLLSMVALALLVVGITQCGSHSGDLIWIAVLVAGLLVSGLFVFLQARSGAEGIVPALLFRDGEVVLSNAAVAAASAALVSLTMALGLTLQMAHGWAPLKAALLLIPAAIVAVVGGPIAGVMSERTRPAVIATIGFGLLGLSLLGLLPLTSSTATSLELILLTVPGAVAGAGIACLWTSLASTATRVVPIPPAGAGAAVHIIARQLGLMIGEAVVVGVFTHAGSRSSSTHSFATAHALAQAASGAMRTAVLVTLVFVLLGGIATGFLARRRPPSDAATIESAPQYIPDMGRTTTPVVAGAPGGWNPQNAWAATPPPAPMPGNAGWTPTAPIAPTDAQVATPQPPQHPGGDGWNPHGGSLG